MAVPGRAQLLLLLRCCHSWGSFRSAIERHSDQIHILYTPGLRGRKGAWEGQGGEPPVTSTNTGTDSGRLQPQRLLASGRGPRRERLP